MIKLVEENLGVNLHEFGLGNDTLHMTPKSQGKKKTKQVNWTSSKFDMWYLNGHQESEKATQRGKYVQIITDKELISRIYKELLKHK